MDNLISVLLPVYNVGKYLRRCLDSIISNTYSSLEIICINDGSTDDSLSILKEYEAIDDRIVIIDKSNGGLSSARNAGMRIAKGSYFAFVDPDDWVHERYFEYLYNAITECNADLAICEFKSCNDDFSFEINPSYSPCIISLNQLVIGSKKSFVWRKLFKRKLLINILFDVNERVEDYIFNMEVILNNNDFVVCYLDAVLYAYYQRENSLARKITSYDRLYLSKRILSFSNIEKREKIKQLMAEISIKVALSSRYDFIILKRKNEVKEANAIIRLALKIVKRRMVYLLFFGYPSIYRYYRIWNDRTMLTYEEELKEKKKMNNVEDR